MRGLNAPGFLVLLLPGAGSRRTCRGVTRKGNWPNRELWRGCGMARVGRRAIPPLLDPEQVLPREGSGKDGQEDGLHGVVLKRGEELDHQRGALLRFL